MATNQLDTLAKQQFSSVAQQETDLLNSIEAGRPYNAPKGTTLRSELIRWLCVNEAAKKLVDPFGIQIHNAIILPPAQTAPGASASASTPVINFASLRIPFPLVLEDCKIEAAFWMQGMEVSFLSLENSKIESIEADVLCVKGDLYLRGTFQSTGPIRLPGATIGGDFDCSGAHFQPQLAASIDQQTVSEAQHVAVYADGVSVAGDLLLKNAIVNGKFSIVGANLHGDLTCADAQFRSGAHASVDSARVALHGDHLELRGTLDLTKSAKLAPNIPTLRGEIRLLGAHIGGQLNCEGALWVNDTIPPPASLPVAGDTDFPDVFTADGCKVDGPVFLRYGFSASGGIRMYGATIGGNLDFTRSKLCGLTLRSATVSRIFIWRNVEFFPDPKIVFRDLTAGAFNDRAEDKTTSLAWWPEPGHLFLDGFAYGHMVNGAGDVFHRIAWVQRDASLAPQPYRLLAKTYRDEGDDLASRKVGYAFAGARAKKEHGFRRVANAISWVFVGYGYYPVIALYWMFGLVLVGTSIFYAAYYSGLVVPVEKEAYVQFKKTSFAPAHYPRFHAFAYSLENSLPVLKFSQIDQWRPDPNPAASLRADNTGESHCVLSHLSASTSLQYFLWLQVCLGWVLGLMGLGAISGVIRKE